MYAPKRKLCQTCSMHKKSGCFFCSNITKTKFSSCKNVLQNTEKKNMCYTVTKLTLMLHFNIYIIIYRAYKWLLFSKKNILIITNFVIVFEVSWGVLTGPNAQL